MKVVLVIITLVLSACADVSQLTRDFNASTAELMGTYTAPTLAASPRPSGCSDDRCKQLDELESRLYEAAARKQITYGDLVSRFYETRARLYPDSREHSGVYEYRAFQQALAEHVDAGKVSPAQWIYLIESKNSEINERIRTRRTVCNTSNAGTREFPEYRTVCRQ